MQHAFLTIFVSRPLTEAAKLDSSSWASLSSLLHHVHKLVGDSGGVLPPPNVSAEASAPPDDSRLAFATTISTLVASINLSRSPRWGVLELNADDAAV